MKLIFVMVAFCLVLSSCTLEKIAPWERNILAKPQMQLDSHAVDDGFDDHIYFSKEASSGGSSLGGGGCGCN